MLGKLSSRFYELLKLPQFRGKDEEFFDTPEASALQREILLSRPMAQELYREYCRPCLESARRARPGATMLEIGAGAGVLKDRLPELLASDVVSLPWLDVVCSAYHLPIVDNSLDRIFLMFVCHHLGNITEFLDEVLRCLKPGGEMVVIDPAITAWSRLYYRYLHVDDMDLAADAWQFDQKGRLSDANVAMAWIVFIRDQERFTSRYPDLVVDKVEYNTCLSYLLSGGARLRQLAPTFLLKPWFRFENLMIRIFPQLSVTMAITLRRRES